MQTVHAPRGCIWAGSDQQGPCASIESWGRAAGALGPAGRCGHRALAGLPDRAPVVQAVGGRRPHSAGLPASIFPWWPARGQWHLDQVPGRARHLHQSTSRPRHLAAGGSATRRDHAPAPAPARAPPRPSSSPPRPHAAAHTAAPTPELLVHLAPPHIGRTATRCRLAGRARA
jgi:hypothetical protein